MLFPVAAILTAALYWEVPAVRWFSPLGIGKFWVSGLKGQKTVNACVSSALVCKFSIKSVTRCTARVTFSATCDPVGFGFHAAINPAK